jgi:hypothetical protein
VKGSTISNGFLPILQSLNETPISEKQSVSVSVYPLLRLDILNRFKDLKFITAVSQSIEMYALKAFFYFPADRR